MYPAFLTSPSKPNSADRRAAPNSAISSSAAYWREPNRFFKSRSKRDLCAVQCVNSWKCHIVEVIGALEASECRHGNKIAAGDIERLAVALTDFGASCAQERVR